jgi:hypothetical protein
VTRGSGAAAREKRGKGRRGGWRPLSRSGRRGGGEREPGSRAVGRKGKADGWGPPVSCPGRMGRGRARELAKLGRAGDAGPARAGWRACGEEREEGERETCSWAGAALAGGLVAHEGY